MYYDCRINHIGPANRIEEIAEAFVNNNTGEFHGFSYWMDGKEYIFVDDSHTEFVLCKEVAIVNQTEKMQIESVRIDCFQLPSIIKQFYNAVLENKFQIRTIAPRTRRENPFELFECKFCHERFRGNLDYQAKFGFKGVLGVCQYCEKDGVMDA